MHLKTLINRAIIKKFYKIYWDHGRNKIKESNEINKNNKIDKMITSNGISNNPLKPRLETWNVMYMLWYKNTINLL